MYAFHRFRIGQPRCSFKCLKIYFLVYPKKNWKSSKLPKYCLAQEFLKASYEPIIIPLSLNNRSDQDNLCTAKILARSVTDLIILRIFEGREPRFDVNCLELEISNTHIGFRNSEQNPHLLMLLPPQ